MQHNMFKRLLPFGMTLFVGLVVGNVFAFFKPRTLPAPPSYSSYSAPSPHIHGGGGCRAAIRRNDASASSAVFAPRDVTRRVEINFKPSPAYTTEARRNMTTGSVRLRAVLTADGRVENVSVVKGLPDGLSEEAISAARQIGFTPALKDGKAVSQYVTLEYNFNLY